MSDIGFEHPFSYRQEIVSPLFETVRAGDSCAVIAPSSMGKSRLVQFVLRTQVQQHYLGNTAASTLLVLVDCNRLAAHSEWGLYELILTALIEAGGHHGALAALRATLNELRREAIVSRDAILAQRHVELAIHMACEEQGLRVCLLIDEFDEAYRTLSSLLFANLRALRDANKYQLCYALLLREHPAYLRERADCEGFYELFSRAIMGLKPYTSADAERVVMQIEARKGYALTRDSRTALLTLSGGHPGLLVALFDALRSTGNPDLQPGAAWAIAEPTVTEECTKLWGSLADRERLALSQHARGIGVTEQNGWQLLRVKGLIRTADGADMLFSPIFTRFVLAQTVPLNQRLLVDEATRVIWIGERAVKDLTAREFDLLAFLYHNLGRVCLRENILLHLYPEEKHAFDIEGQDNRVDTLVKRVREKIEPIRSQPCYLLTVRGKGYQLVERPETDPFAGRKEVPLQPVAE